MKIEVTRRNSFVALKINFGDISYDSGLLDAKEAKDIALDLLNAAGELLPQSMNEFDSKLADLVNEHF